MSTPEILPQQPAQPEVVSQAPTQVEVPAAAEHASQNAVSIQAIPADPRQLMDPTGQIMAQPVPAPQDDANLPTFEVPEFQSEEQIEKYSHGEATNSITWKAVSLLRQIHSKAMHGVRIIFGQQTQQ